jgi:aminotransferase
MNSAKQTSDSGTQVRYNLMELAASMEGVITLGRGDPDLDTPRHIVEAAQNALRWGAALEMPPSQGLLELRQAIAAKLLRENNLLIDPETEVQVTTGGQESLFFLIQALVNPGDEILMPDPRYTSYDAAINLAGGRIVPVPTYEEDDFDLRPEEVESRITANSKALLLVTPGNPTSGVVSPSNIRRLAEIAQERNLIVISDEIYEHYLYDGAQHLSIASLPGMRDRTVTLNAVSKSYAMTGWRVGYVAAPAPLVDAICGLKSIASRATSVVSQWAATAALNGPQDCVEEYRRIYDRRRRVLMAGLDAMGFVYGRPRGAFYIFPNASSVGVPAGELAYLLLKEGRVLVFPGTSFGETWSQHLRMSFLASEAQLQEAVARMARVLDTCVRK